MLSFNIGPVAFPTMVLGVLAALLVTAGVGRLVGRGRRSDVGNVVIDMLLTAVLVARVAFVVAWFNVYRARPWSMIDLRDGGFTLWAGVAAALLVALWRGWRQPDVRRPLATGLAAGLLVWGGVFGAIRLMENATIPRVPLQTLSGESTSLARLAQGRPMVVNLWATWCGPCRREMPVLAAAQQQHSGIHFVFANQGESAEAAQRYLGAVGLDLANVVIDSGARIGREVGSSSLPTTLFYDQRGRLVDTHLGALSEASLASKLARLR